MKEDHVDTESLIAALRDSFASLIEADEADVEAGPAFGEVEVVGETWTLHLEGLPETPRAWLAIDDEPENAAEIRAAREAAVGPEAMAALVRADTVLGGALSCALSESDDPLSLDLAAALRAAAPQPPAG
ncbi:MAG: hypothetical protein M3Q71_04230 [Chloroflexota bacterium]|nr:hypothetical protein [Chloroflexota bacterium]